MLRTSSVLLALLATSTSALAQEDPERVHIRMHKRIAPSVVFVQGGGQSGSGVCIDKSGVILTSPSACGTATDSVTVVGAGNKRYTGKVIGRNNDKELVLVKIEATMPAVELGDSDQVKLGQIAYVFGDSYGSIAVDDQVAISLGVVSARYELTKKRGVSTYVGPVIETSAAVNPNQDGGPLINSDGRLIGLVTLNYEDSKFTGVAVPVNQLKSDIAAILKKGDPSTTVKTDPKPAGWLGAAVEEVDDVAGLRVKGVAYSSPAAKAGLKVGDVITRIDAKKVLTTKGFAEALAKFETGASVKLRIERDGKEQDVTVTLGKRNDY